MWQLLDAFLHCAYVHDLSPFLLDFGGGFGIRWYGLSYLAGFLSAYWLMTRFSRTGKSPLGRTQIGDFVFAAAMGTLIGGRLGYCIFYNPALFTSFSQTFPFWGVLEVNKGGMASHGGIIGIVVACWYFARKHRLSFLHLMDLVAVTGPVGIFFGRIANFINGELFGRETTVSWAVKFPREIFDWTPEQLRSLSRTVGALGISEQDWARWIHADYRRVYEMLELIVMNIESGNALVRNVIEPVLTARHPSQLYEALAEGLILFAVLLACFIRSRRPGIAAASFFIFYPIGRIVCEHFRLPDASIGFQLWGLTRGQWLSIGLMVLGIIGIACNPRKSAKVELPG